MKLKLPNMSIKVKSVIITCCLINLCVLALWLAITNPVATIALVTIAIFIGMICFFAYMLYCLVLDKLKKREEKIAYQERVKKRGY